MLNPNSAQARYAQGWTETLLGDADHGQAHADQAMSLSPLDPMLYGMLGVRALSHMVLDEPDAAAHWGERACRAPQAHALIEMIAAIAHQLNGSDTQALKWMRSARHKQPHLGTQDFLNSFPFHGAEVRQRIEVAARTLDAQI